MCSVRGSAVGGFTFALTSGASGSEGLLAVAVPTFPDHFTTSGSPKQLRRPWRHQHHRHNPPAPLPPSPHGPPGPPPSAPPPGPSSTPSHDAVRGKPTAYSGVVPADCPVYQKGTACFARAPAPIDEVGAVASSGGGHAAAAATSRGGAGGGAGWPAVAAPATQASATRNPRSSGDKIQTAA